MERLMATGSILAAVLFAAPYGIPGWNSAMAYEGQAQAAPWRLADVRTYRHCHNTPRRVYCHTREHLPVTPPKSPTART